jgi:hypothetical protein
MVDIFGSGTLEEEGSSDMGISYSDVPTERGPRYLGNAGTGLRLDNILILCRVSKKEALAMWL